MAQGVHLVAQIFKTDTLVTDTLISEHYRSDLYL